MKRVLCAIAPLRDQVPRDESVFVDHANEIFTNDERSNGVTADPRATADSASFLEPKHSRHRASWVNQLECLGDTPSNQEASCFLF